MSQENSRELDHVKIIRLAANGNRQAEEYLHLIRQLEEVLWDKHDPYRAAHLAIVALPRNPFFAAHAGYLTAIHDLLVNVRQDARGSVDWCWFYELACVVAGLTGGYDYRRKVSPEIRGIIKTPFYEELTGEEIPRAPCSMQSVP